METLYHPEALSIAEDIKNMKIRGAGRVARAAVKALLFTARHSKATNTDSLIKELESTAKMLMETRPTAVSLPNGLRYVLKRVSDAKGYAESTDAIRKITSNAALQFIAESKRAVERIGEIGARRIGNGDTILTHCNSEAAISIIATAWRQGKDIRVFATETRPRLQGRTTVRRLGREGIPTTLIIDSAARHFMNKVDKVVVGSDAVAANGAVVNKIGTSMIALAAKEARTPFYVAAETYKFSPATTLGELIRIEERDASEVIPKGTLQSLKNVTVRNPSFDVTPPQYIDLIITEKGVIPPQYAISVIQQEFGWALFEEGERPITPEDE
ncbi:MAG: ribose 1,5-bisphosphate isomerase [Candidatus Bathyarchaeia archaeon]